MQAVTPITPLEAGGEMFQRAKTASLFEARTSQLRPVSQVSEATEILDTDFEDESDYEGASPKSSFESYDSRRRSQTTISSYDEARTPSPRTSTHSRPPLQLQIQPVQGPKGPHLFRSSTVSAEFDFDYALQMSPVLPKEAPFRTHTAFSDDTVTPLTSVPNQSFSIAMRLPEAHLHDPEAHIRSWSTQQVIDWMYETGIDSTVIECFDIHDINGDVLLDLEFEDLKELDIASFGKRHQLWNAICLLKGEEGHPSPQPTPFQDISRPCTANTRRSPSRGRLVQGAEDDDRSASPARGKSKRRGRKAPKNNDMITPAESVSIVAIEQLLPKPHTCAKGERCAKWRKQQRDLQQLKDENGLGRFPISPTKGGRIFVSGDPGNATTAENMIPNAKLQPFQQHTQGQLRLEDPFRQTNEIPEPSAGFPSVVASSDLLGPGQLPDFALHQDILDRLGSRDPQDNVKQFLNFQHIQSPIEENRPPSPPLEMFPSKSVSPFPAITPQQFYHEAPAVLQLPQQTQNPHGQLKSLPRLEIPRSASAGPQLNSGINGPRTAGPHHANPYSAVGLSICRSATASPGTIYRLGTPASEMDVPTTALPFSNDPVSRDASQSVPPNMQYNPQQNLSRSHSRASEAPGWRRPSMQLPAVMEGEVFSPSSDGKSSRRPSTQRASSDPNTAAFPQRSSSIRDPAKHSPVTHDFGYGSECTHSGFMKRRQRTKMLRHEWSEAHYRLKGTQLTQHANARLSASIQNSINVDDYAVACSSLAASNSKLSSAFKAFSISSSKSDEATKTKEQDVAAFAFQLVPQAKEGEKRSKAVATGKTHHFAVKSKDQRIDWMRELMLAKAREQKEKGFEVEVNGVQA